jgi:hypothetical protein
MTAAQETRLLRATPAGRALCYKNVDAVRDARAALEKAKREHAAASAHMKDFWFNECLFRAQMLGMATAHLHRAMRAEATG